MNKDTHTKRTHTLTHVLSQWISAVYFISQFSFRRRYFQHVLSSLSHPDSLSLSLYLYCTSWRTLLSFSFFVGEWLVLCDLLLQTSYTTGITEWNSIVMLTVMCTPKYRNPSNETVIQTFNTYFVLAYSCLHHFLSLSLVYTLNFKQFAQPKRWWTFRLLLKLFLTYATCLCDRRFQLICIKMLCFCCKEQQKRWLLDSMKN